MTAADATSVPVAVPQDGVPQETAPEVAMPIAAGAHWSTVPGGLTAAIEAVLMVSEEPVTETQLAQALNCTVDYLAEQIRRLAEYYRGTQRGFELRQLAGGWRIYSRADLADVVDHFIIGGQQARLTQAALETLAVVAYRQPVSRSRVGAVRGVNVDGVMRTLAARGLIEECRHDTDGAATRYQTTPLFLERMGLATLDDLPPIAPHLPELTMLDDLPETDLP